MISQSCRASPGGASACRPIWTRRSVFVNVPVFSGNADAGSTTSAKAGGLGEEDLLHHQVLELCHRLARVAQVGIGHRRVLAHDVHALDPAGEDRVHDLDHRQPRVGIERRPPGGLEDVTGPSPCPTGR